MGYFLQVLGGDVTPGCADTAGLDEDDVDAVGPEFHAEGVGESFDGVLRHVVPGSEIAGEVTSDGGGVDDAAVVLTAHVWQHELGEACQAEEVDVELSAGFVQGHVLHCSEVAVAGVVDKYIYVSLGLDDGLHGGAARVGVGDVELQGPHALGAQGLQELQAAGGAIDDVALAGQSEGGLAAYAATGAREEDDFLGHDGDGLFWVGEGLVQCVSGGEVTQSLRKSERNMQGNAVFRA